MPKAYSVDLRERIVEAYRDAGLTADEVAKQYRVGQKTVYRYAEMDAETGDLTPGKPPGRTPTVGENEYPVIKELVRNKPHIELEELCEEVGKATGKWVGVSAMCKICKKLNLKRKKLSVFAQEQEREDIKKNAGITLTRAKKSTRKI